MGRPVKRRDVAATLGAMDTAELLDQIWRAGVEAEARLEDAAAELHRLHIVARELAERLGCAPVAPMLPEEGEIGTPRDPAGA